VFYKTILVAVVMYCVEPYGEVNIVWGAGYRVLSGACTLSGSY